MGHTRDGRGRRHIRRLGGRVHRAEYLYGTCAGNHKVVAITVILRNRRNTEVPGILFSED
ncbi:hypothetical protein BIFAD42_13700 [Bifidobacterium adolescentis]|uniref:Uncharacterized protein n=1 Tax=Bifidobacterium adolescentis TaxID=1680 RepID=A0AAN5AF51_BIFAD|nr:hypothetical protein BIFAD42_13700 [Bifidobacterium adolescentis]